MLFGKISGREGEVHYTFLYQKQIQKHQLFPEERYPTMKGVIDSERNYVPTTSPQSVWQSVAPSLKLSKVEPIY